MDGALGVHSFPDGPDQWNPTQVLYGAFNDDPEYWNATTLTPGGDAFDTIIHELGHGLGLAHPHDGGGLDGATKFPGATEYGTGQYGLNQSVFTVMSYNPGWNGAPTNSLDYGQPLTPMAFDIAALQALYGANTTYKNGSDTYILPTVNSSGTGWTCIWDTGGEDTISGASATKALTINLNEATLIPGANAGGFVSWVGGISGGFTIAKNAVIENAIGGSGADTLVGNGEDNDLNGGAGADKMSGGAGVDHYLIDNLSDTVTELLGNGLADMVESSVALKTAFANVEIFTLTSAVNWNFTGNLLDNTITGNNAVNTLGGGGGNDTMTGGSANDTLDGGTGNDTMTGNNGNDAYVVDSLDDVVVEKSSEGTDTVKSSALIANTTNFAEVENFTFTGKGNWIFVGNGLVNIITGGAGNDDLDGGAGADALNGGAGNDTYHLDDPNDTVTDTGGTNDMIFSTALITKAMTGIESYGYTGSSNWNFTGDDLNNSLTGGSGSDHLIGGKGNDTLDGGTGTDTLEGGIGNDTYLVDNAGDIVVEADKSGTDLVKTSTNLDFSTNPGFQNQWIENITLLNGAVTVTGNDLANTILGNNNGNTISGGKGNDTITGGSGDDTLNGNEGLDKLTGGEGINTLNGGADNDTLMGGSVADTLDGGAGNDSMTGGKGDDVYIVGSIGDKVIESLTFAAGGGTDTVKSAITVSLAALANIDNLTLTGSTGQSTDTDKINGTGNALANTITGNNGDNVLDGGTGVDTLIGGGGNDTFLVDNLVEVALMSDAAGIDTIKTAQKLDSAIHLVAGVENYTYTGTQAWSFDASAHGNEANTLTGNSGADTLAGGGGDDTLNGGTGIDSLTGGTGDDIYIVDNVKDTVTEGNAAGSDTVKTSALIANAANFANIENFTYLGIAAWTFTGNDENNVITAGTGTGADKLTGGKGDDTLFGNDGNDILDGGAADDAMTGGKGDDTYFVDSASDTFSEAGGAGKDTVKSLVDIDLTGNTDIENITLLNNAVSSLSPLTATGNDLANIIIGNNGDAVNGGNFLSGGKGSDTLTGGERGDTLDGGADNDTMTGGKGDDVYVVNAIGDKVVESLTFAAGGGTDTVRSAINFSLAALANIDNLTLTGSTGKSTDTDAINGTGNALANTVTGNDGNNVLDGGKGNDFYVGGGGNDTFLVDNLVELGQISDASGSDTIKTALKLDSAVDLVAGVENYAYTGTLAWTFDLSARGNENNALTGGSGADKLTGGDGDDTLSGGTGIDILIGGDGDDTYIVDNVKDTIIEIGGEGHDLVKSSITLTALFAEVEDLTLTGTGAINGTGNGEDNTITGNDGRNVLSGLIGEDVLIGGKGDDTLTGGADQDIFRYLALTDRGTGTEIITDFSKAEGDVLDVADLFTGGGPADVASAFSGGFLKLDHPVNGNTVVSIDVDGGGNSFATLVTLKSVTINTTDTASFDVT
jgi:Ca2+-binding RTX toxin-like protein